MRFVVRNSFAHQTIRSERVEVSLGKGCTECGQSRVRRTLRSVRYWLYRFHVDGDSASTSGSMIGGKLFCSRSCAQDYCGHNFDEMRNR